MCELEIKWLSLWCDPPPLGLAIPACFYKMYLKLYKDDSEDFRLKVKRLQEIEYKYDKLATYCKSQEDQDRCTELLRERTVIKRALKAAFKSPFGSTFRTDLTRSHYAREVERFAELYTSSVRNFDGICLERFLLRFF